MKKLSIKLNMSNFADFLAKLQDLSNISDVIKLKIEKDNILIYSIKSNESITLAIKNYTIPTSTYFDDYKEEDMFDFIIVNSPKLIKSLKFFDTTIQIKLDIIYKKSYDDEDVMQVRSGQFSNGKLKISTVGGEDNMIADVNTTFLETRMDISKSIWGFGMSKLDFIDIKKLCAIDSENKILNINVEGGKISAEETSKWELTIGDIDPSLSHRLVFNKKYLSNVNAELDIINFSMFETFILIKDQNSNLMMSFEQTFDGDD